MLLITVALEELVRVQIIADSFEDEQRLRYWLRRASVLPRLGLDVTDVIENAA